MADTWWIKAAELDPVQRDLIKLPVTGHHLVTGPPGSGKTNILLMRANFLVRAGFPDILILVFNRILREFVVAGGAEYAFPPEKIKTCIKWQMEVINEVGTLPALPDDFEARRDILTNTCAELVNRGRVPRVDAILLDEAQDYSTAELQLFARLTPRLFAVADARQRIYRADSMADLAEITGPAKELKFHYRSGRKICELADGLRHGMADDIPLLPTCRYNEEARPSSVEIAECDSNDEIAAKMLDRLRLQLKAYPGEWLGVLAPRNQEADAIWDRLSGSELGNRCVRQSFDDGYEPFDADKPICISTIHGAKGLEFRGVHLCGLEQLPKFRNHQRNLCYTAISRTKTSLSIYRTGALPGYVEAAYAALSPPPPLPEVEDLFKGGGG